MKKILFASMAALSLSACASGALTVEQPNRSAFKTNAAQVVYDDSLVGVENEDVAYTQRKMEEAFFGGKSPIFDRGAGLTVRFRYIGFDEGSRVGRYMTMGLMGGSDIVLETEFVGPDGQVLSRVRGNGNVRGGFLGGSSRSGIDKAVDEIADYAAVQFKR